MSVTLKTLPQPGVNLDYDIFYVRCPRPQDPTKAPILPDIARPLAQPLGSDIMRWSHVDGSETLFAAAGNGAYADLKMSFDGNYLYATYYNDQSGLDFSGNVFTAKGADVWKFNIATGQGTNLTANVGYDVNTGAVPWGPDLLSTSPPKGKVSIGFKVFNIHPCPLPNGQICFTSSRHGLAPHKNGNHHPALQLCVMNEDGTNLTTIGPMHIGTALHPICLQDGRIAYSSMESQGLRSGKWWGTWGIHPDGTNWEPLWSAFPYSETSSFHFQTQLSNGNIVNEVYYTSNDFGMGTLGLFAPSTPQGFFQFGPGDPNDPRNVNFPTGPVRSPARFPFTPYLLTALTPWATFFDDAADLSDPNNPNSTRVGKLTHPGAAADNHLLASWSNGPVCSNVSVNPHTPYPNNQIVLIVGGQPTTQPGDMVAIGTLDPLYNKTWPTAGCSYMRLCGLAQPRVIAPLANDGSINSNLPEGTPFGLIGTSSVYKRESYPQGKVTAPSVTAGFNGVPPDDVAKGFPLTAQTAQTTNFFKQGGDHGLYSNDDIVAMRILQLEPPSLRMRGGPVNLTNYVQFQGRLWYNSAYERMKILGEVPLRHFNGGVQLTDPDGNPDTSFLAVIPSLTPFTFQLVNKRGMALTTAQTWHQLEPGELRWNCGGCHAHSQRPTSVLQTAAGQPGYVPLDLTAKTWLLTAKANDQYGQQLNVANDVGLRYVTTGPVMFDFYRDIKPILVAKCVSCHTTTANPPPMNLAFDRTGRETIPSTGTQVPTEYFVFGADENFKYAPIPPTYPAGFLPYRSVYAASRIIAYKQQSLRSILAWKLENARTDGWQNGVLNDNLDFVGTQCQANAVTTDEEKRLFYRWIDTCCSVDLDPDGTQWGLFCNDQRPSLNVTIPAPGANTSFTRILLGGFSYNLDPKSLSVKADFVIDGNPAGTELAGLFTGLSGSRYQYTLVNPPQNGQPQGTLTVTIKDLNGNISTVKRTFLVTPPMQARKGPAKAPAKKK
jgi:hypothetical protein